MVMRFSRHCCLLVALLCSNNTKEKEKESTNQHLATSFSSFSSFLLSSFLFCAFLSSPLLHVDWLYMDPKPKKTVRFADGTVFRDAVAVSATSQKTDGSPSEQHQHQQQQRKEDENQQQQQPNYGFDYGGEYEEDEFDDQHGGSRSLLLQNDHGDGYDEGEGEEGGNSGVASRRGNGSRGRRGGKQAGHRIVNAIRANLGFGRQQPQQPSSSSVSSTPAQQSQKKTSLNSAVELRSLESGDVDLGLIHPEGGEEETSEDDLDVEILTSGGGVGMVVDDGSDGQDRRGRGASLLSSIVNLANTIMGAGILALPYAIHSSGLILGVLSLFFVYLMANFSLHLLLLCSTFVKTRTTTLTYKELAKEAHGWLGVGAVAFGVIGGCFGTMSSYLVIITDAVIPFIALATSMDVEDITEHYRIVVLTVVLVAVLPLACLRKLDSLKFSSSLAMLGVFYLVLLIVVRGIQLLSQGSLAQCLEREGCFSLWKVTIATTNSIPIITLAFSCQMNFFTILAELHHPTFQRMTSVNVRATTICFFVYLIVSVFGYLSFYDATRGNILLNFATDDTLANIGRVAMVLVITTSFPMMSHPCVKTFDDIAFPQRAPSRWRWIMEAIAFSLGAWGVAVLVSDVSVIISFVGATAASTIIFILPASCYLTLVPDKRLFAPRKVISWFLLATGVLFMILRTYSLIVVDIMQGGD